MPATITRKSRRVVEDPSIPPKREFDPSLARELAAIGSIEHAQAAKFAEALEKKRAKKSTHGPLPEALNNTTTPAGIAANDPDAVGERWQETPEGAVQQIDLEDLVRHPDNRHPAEQEIVAMMARFQGKGQLEPIVVWQPPPGLSQWHGGKSTSLVILSGETRWLAALRLQWPTLQGRVASGLTPAQALEHVAAFNGERRDLESVLALGSWVRRS